MRRVAYALLFLTSGSALAAEVPIFGAYGDLQNCVLWRSAAEPMNNNNSTLLTRSELVFMEGGCEFGTVTQAAPRTWRVDAKCGGEGEEWAAALTIRESEDRKTVTLTGLKTPMVLTTCHDYERLLREEVRRLKIRP